MTRCRRMTEAHVRSIMQQLLSAVGFLHRCRVVHRDIKPQNILIYCKCSSGSIEQQENAICNCAAHDIEVVLADFGLCRIVEPSASSVLSPTLSPQRGSTPAPSSPKSCNIFNSHCYMWYQFRHVAGSFAVEFGFWPVLGRR